MLWLLAVKKKKLLHLHQLQQLKLQQQHQQLLLLMQSQLTQLLLLQQLMLSQLMLLLQPQQLTLSQLTQLQQNNQLIIGKADLRVGFFYACEVCPEIVRLSCFDASTSAVITATACSSDAYPIESLFLTRDHDFAWVRIQCAA